MGHPAVREAAVVAVPHPTWGERPVAAVVLREGAQGEPEELATYLEPRFARFWLPDAYVFVEQLPRTATGSARAGAAEGPPVAGGQRRPPVKRPTAPEDRGRLGANRAVSGDA